MLDLKITVSPPKKHKTRSNSGIKLIGKSKRGVVFQDEDGTYKVYISMENDPNYPDLLVIPFTERSYDIVGRTTVFTREVDEHGKRTRYIRSELKAKFMPGDPKRYIPFAPNWIVKGHIVRENGTLKFDFDDIITIKGYDVFVNDEDE